MRRTEWKRAKLQRRACARRLVPVRNAGQKPGGRPEGLAPPYRFKQPMTSVYRATLPFYLILLAGVLLITYVPELTTLPVKWLGL